MTFKATTSIFLIGLSLPASAMTIAYSGYLPETLLYKNGQFTGSHAPLVNCFHNLVAGDKDRVIETPPARQLQMLQSGGLDISYVLTQTSERDQFAYASKPFYAIEAWLLTRANEDTTTIRSVATVRNSYGVNEIKKMGAIYINANSYAQALNMLDHGRVDAALVSGLASSLDADILSKMNKKILTKTALVVYVSRKTPNAKKIARRYSLAITACKEGLNQDLQVDAP